MTLATQTEARTDLIPPGLERVAEVFETRIDSVVAAIIAGLRDELDDWRAIDSPEAWGLVAAITRDTRLLQAEALRAGMVLPETCPQPDAEGAAISARAGVPLATVLKSRRIGVRCALDGWLYALADSPLAGSAEAVETLTRFLLDYDHRCTDLFVEVYLEAERAARLHGHSRLAGLRRVLTGDAETLTGEEYDLGGWHLAVIGWGDRVDRSLRRLAGTAGGGSLLVEVSEDGWWAWFGGDERAADAALREVQCLDLEPGCGLACGAVGRGTDGFRSSHRQAGEAHRVATFSGEPVTLFADVALVAMALRDPASAAEFAATTLGPAMTGDDDRAIALRLTLDGYFATAQNAASAAAALGVHEHTVARRIRGIEERLGCSVNDARPELELALRLRELLAPPDST
jgi:hypothetical protein